MKVLFIVARQTAMGSYHMPLGMGFISAGLKQAGHEVEILNPNHSLEDPIALIEATLTRFQPQVVALGGLSFHFGQVKVMAALVKRILPDIPVLVGGPLLTDQAVPVFEALTDINVGVIGEGEYTTVELIAALEVGSNLEQVKGIIYRDTQTGAIQQTPPRPMEMNLDALPWCDYEGLGIDVFSRIHRPGECAPGLILDFGTRVMPLLTSRGCPYSCTFCCHEEKGHNYRMRSLDDVFNEVNHAIKNFNINTLFIYDDLFCPQRERLEDFCNRITPLNMRWGCSMVAGQIDADIVARMKIAGCVYISIGLESMSPVVLKSMKKKDPKERIEKALAQIYDAGIAVWSNLIFGDPAETMETAMESLEWMWHHSHYNIRTAMIGYHPGSLIYKQAIQRNLIGDPIDFLTANCPEINATSMSDEEYKKLQRTIDTGLWLFGYAGKLFDVKLNDDGYIWAQTECPVCGASGTCYTIKPDYYSIPCLNCPECNRPYRVPLIVRKKAPLNVTYWLDSLEVLEECGANIDALNALCNQILTLYTNDNRVWQCQAKIAEIIGDYEKAFYFNEIMLKNDPYNPILFESMANRLIQKGEEFSAEKFILKAKHLRRVGVEHTFYVELE